MNPLDNETVLLAFDQPPRRVVSLIPSMTESLYDMGVGDRLVGITDFCQPKNGTGALLTRVGGTRSPDIETVRRLEPDLVIANREENSRDAVEGLGQVGMTIWLTFPKSTLDALNLLWTLVKLFKLGEQAARVETMARTLDWTDRATTGRLAIPTFCPIWQGEKANQGPWFMTFNYQTYAHDVLAKSGGMNVFAGRMRRYPLEADLGIGEAEEAGERDIRYPRVTLEEVRKSAPDVILLPSEPFAFDENHKILVEGWLADTPAVQSGRVHLIDGSLITWHGTRMGKALSELPVYFHR
ncbi:MAG: ABC transporter substrate-binding protein [Anaerolineales bacterium]